MEIGFETDDVFHPSSQPAKPSHVSLRVVYTTDRQTGHITHKGTDLP